MRTLPQWRSRCFVAGLFLLIAGGIALGIAGWREHRWMYSKTFYEGAFWVYGGLLAAAASVLLLLCGRGWSRWLLAILALVELYLWFSWMAFAVMVH